MRIGLGKHVAERKNEVVQVPMIVEPALILIKRGIRALRISVQNPDHPLFFVVPPNLLRLQQQILVLSFLLLLPPFRSAIKIINENDKMGNKSTHLCFCPLVRLHFLYLIFRPHYELLPQLVGLMPLRNTIQQGAVPYVRGGAGHSGHQAGLTTGQV